MDVNIWYDYLKDSKYSLLLYMSLELGQVHYYINYLYDKANIKIPYPQIEVHNGK